MYSTMAFRARPVALFRQRIGSRWLIGRTRGLATVSEGTQCVTIPLTLSTITNRVPLQDPTMSS
jgi:hypothetical protein